MQALCERLAGLQPALRAISAIRFTAGDMQPALRAVCAGKKRTLGRTGKHLHARYTAHAHFYVLATIRGQSGFKYLSIDTKFAHTGSRETIPLKNRNFDQKYKNMRCTMAFFSGTVRNFITIMQ